MFVGWIVLIKQLPIQLFFSFWAGGFVGGITNEMFHQRGFLNIFSLIAFCAVPIVFYARKKLDYGRTSYRFYADHVEFEEGFFSPTRKTIAYKNVLEVTMQRGLLQRVPGLGTVYLGTLATGSGRSSNPFESLGLVNLSTSGGSLQDVMEADALYVKIKELVAANGR